MWSLNLKKIKIQYIKTYLWLFFFDKEQKMFTLPCQYLPSITQFLAFPKVEISQPWKEPHEESLIDCTKSIMMTS
jgi:hypothetical protein